MLLKVGDSRIESSAIVAIRPIEEHEFGGGHPPRVVVDYRAGEHGNSLVLPFEDFEQAREFAGRLAHDVDIALACDAADESRRATIRREANEVEIRAMEMVMKLRGRNGGGQRGGGIMLTDCGDGWWADAASIIAIRITEEGDKALLCIEIQGAGTQEEPFDSYEEARVQGDRIAAAANKALAPGPPAPSGWISVAERVPDGPDFVMGFQPTGPGYVINLMRHRASADRVMAWFGVRDEVVHPTHWMPIPGPPR
jgi:hypothetical protein